MPLLKRKKFSPHPPAADLKPDDEVFVCEATNEVFLDYEEFFQRTIMCNSLVWSCCITGKSNLTYQEAVESEQAAKRRLGSLSKPLKRALLWLASRTQRGKLSDLLDDVYTFAHSRFFIGETVEVVSQGQWRDCRILKVFAPCQEEINQASEGHQQHSASPKGKKAKKVFSPPDHLFKYQVQAVDEPEQAWTAMAQEIRREKGTFSREKNQLFLKNAVKTDNEGNFMVEPKFIDKLSLKDVQFEDLFAGPQPQFQVSKRVVSRKKGGQSTLDGWVTDHKGKRKSAQELAADMKRIGEQNERLKQETKRRADEAKRKKIEEKALEKERRKEEKQLLAQVLADWRRTRDDLECDDLKELPLPRPVQCGIPNSLFGDFLTLLEFFASFSELLEVKDSFQHGITFDLLENALVQSHAPAGPLYDIVRFMIETLFELQRQEDEEVKLGKLPPIEALPPLDKNILGKDEGLAMQIRSATKMSRWSMDHQGGQALHELHMNEFSITEILRLHLLSSGAFRSDKMTLWSYQQRGGYRLSDDPGLQFKMDAPHILDALCFKTIYELSIEEKIKILHCLMLQILNYSTVRDDIDERFSELQEAKSDLRNHQIAENKRIRAMEDALKTKRRVGKQKEELPQVVAVPNAVAAVDTLCHLTERQKEALQAQRDKEEKDRLKKLEQKKMEALQTEKALSDRVADSQKKVGPILLGRDRAYRRFWMLQSVPGIFVEYDDEHVGPCLPQPTPYTPNAQPLDERAALEKVKSLLAARSSSSTDEKSSSDKENDSEQKQHTYARKAAIHNSHTKPPKVLCAKNEEAMKPEPKEEPLEGDTPAPTTIHLPWGACLSDAALCSVHSVPDASRSKWAFFSTTEDVDALINALNPRGIRESDLKERISSDRERILKELKKFGPFEAKLSGQRNALKTEDLNTVSTMIGAVLREQILDMEEKIFFGSLGTLKVRDRSCWQKAIQDGGYDNQCDSLSWGNGCSLDTLGSKDKEPRVQDIAGAILQVAQMVDAKYLKEPLGESDKEKRKKTKTKDEDRRKKDKESDTGTPASFETGVKSDLTPLQEWESSLMQSTSVAQLFLHLTTLESSIIWSKSIMNAKCRICRRKNDDEKMLLCDGCDRGHHLYCLKPKLKSVPAGNWFCNECKPKERSPKKKNRRVFSVDEDDQDSSSSGFQENPDESDDEDNDEIDSKRLFECDDHDKERMEVDGDDDDDEEEEEGGGVDDEHEKDQDEDAPLLSRRKVTLHSCDEDDDEGGHHRHQQIDDGNPSLSSASSRSRKRHIGDSCEKNEDAEGDTIEDGCVVEKKSTSKKRCSQGRHDLPMIQKKRHKQGSGSKSDSSRSSLSGFLHGKRRCATQAIERISRTVNQEIGSAVSSSLDCGERFSNRLRGRTRLSDGFTASGGSGGGGCSLARSKRRRAVDDKLDALFNPTVLEDLLNTMIKHKDGWPFDRPITKAEAPDYHDIIDRPMDLGTIRSTILRMKYSCNQEVLDDIRQVFVNCFTYNRPGAQEFQCGVRLEKFFLKETKKLGLMDEHEQPQSGNFLEPGTGTLQQQLPSKKIRKTL